MMTVSTICAFNRFRQLLGAAHGFDASHAHGALFGVIVKESHRAIAEAPGASA